MNKDLLEVFEHEIMFLKPYIKQFKNELHGNNVLVLESKEINLKNIIKELDLVENDNTINGIILFELTQEMISDLLEKYYNKLDDESVILIINSNKEYRQEILDFIFKDKFIFMEEYIGDDKWNFLLYKKSTIK